jgi:Fur family iron response transcriptional regulator
MATSEIAERLFAHGIQPTAQRRRIAAVLLSAPQHMSAEQLLAQLVADGARVSKATVYNTLNLFASRGLIRPLTVDGARVWFDSNVEAHYQPFATTTRRDGSRRNRSGDPVTQGAVDPGVPRFASLWGIH